ncbi:MAG: hypothetical protein PUP92_09640 [Rhizonema sp. PD38]|nr:hypothetical protein [Rhizonema sp. PD38]
MKLSTIAALMRVYDQLEEITSELYNLVDAALEMRDFEDASLLQARADILYEQNEQMENLDIVILEHEG